MQARIYRLNRNGSLPFEQLHYLWLAANMSYEDELVVVLPASGTGFVARAHAVNNGFHAFTLLQNLIREHGQALGVRQAIGTARRRRKTTTATRRISCGCRRRPTRAVSWSTSWPGPGARRPCAPMRRSTASAC